MRFLSLSSCRMRTCAIEQEESEEEEEAWLSLDGTADESARMITKSMRVERETLRIDF